MIQICKECENSIDGKDYSDYFKKAFGKDNFEIPIAPAEGLYLSRVIYLRLNILYDYLRRFYMILYS